QADLNLYAYVSGAVLKNVDPLGLCANEGSGGCAATDGSDTQGNTATQEQKDFSAGHAAGVMTYAVNSEAANQRYDIESRFKRDMAAADRLQDEGHPEFAQEQRMAAGVRRDASLGELDAWHQETLADVARTAPGTEAGRAGFAKGNTRWEYVKDRIIGGVVEAGLSYALGGVGARIANVAAKAVARSLATKGVASAERLAIGRGKDLASGLKAGETKLQWPSKLPDFKAEWKMNSGFLRQWMQKGQPI